MLLIAMVGVAFLYAVRPAHAAGEPGPFTPGTAVLVVGYLLFPLLGLLAAGLLLVAALLLAGHILESRRSSDGSDASADGGAPDLPVGAGDPGGPRRPWAMQATLIPVGAGLFCLLYLAITALRAGESSHIDVTPLSTGFAFGAGLAIAAGGVALWHLREASIGVRFALAVGLLVFSLLAMFSIGLATLPVALLLLGFGVRQLMRRRSSSTVRAALAGGLIGVGAIAYLLVLIQPAAAECRADGGGATSSGGLFGPIAVSQGGYSMPSGESGGYIDEGDRITYFTCHEGKLTDFHREYLPQGQWVVTTQPFATVGRTVFVVFRIRPREGESLYSEDGFDFSVICRTCPEPRPIVRGRAERTGTRAPGSPGASVTFAGQIAFPAAGSWYTSPYDAPIEVR